MKILSSCTRSHVLSNFYDFLNPMEHKRIWLMWAVELSSFKKWFTSTITYHKRGPSYTFRIFRVIRNHTIALCDERTEVSKLLFSDSHMELCCWSLNQWNDLENLIFVVIWIDDSLTRSDSQERYLSWIGYCYFFYVNFSLLRCVLLRKLCQNVKNFLLFLRKGLNKRNVSLK